MSDISIHNVTAGDIADCHAYQNYNHKDHTYMVSRQCVIACELAGAQTDYNCNHKVNI